MNPSPSLSNTAAIRRRGGDLEHGRRRSGGRHEEEDQRRRRGGRRLGLATAWLIELVGIRVSISNVVVVNIEFFFFF